MTEGLWRDFPKQPAVFELAVFVRSEDLGKKAWLRGDESEVDEFLDMRILNRLWGFLPLPKNRGAHCSPRHVETRLGSSQLFWSAEPLFENPVAWDATGTAEKLGMASSKSDGFSLMTILERTPSKG